MPDEPLGVVDQARHQAREPLGPVAARELLQRALGHRRRRDLRGQVAKRHPRNAHVGSEHLEHRLDGLAAVVQAQPGESDALLEDLGVVAGGRAGQPPADVAVVRGRRREADERAVEEDRLEDEDVLQVDAAVERVVHHEHVSRPQPIAPLREQVLHRDRHRAEVERHGHRLSDRLAARVAERGREVHSVAHHGGVRGAEDRRRHLVGDRGQRVADDLHRDRVDSGASHRPPPSTPGATPRRPARHSLWTNRHEVDALLLQTRHDFAGRLDRIGAGGG